MQINIFIHTSGDKENKEIEREKEKDNYTDIDIYMNILDANIYWKIHILNKDRKVKAKREKERYRQGASEKEKGIRERDKEKKIKRNIWTKI